MTQVFVYGTLKPGEVNDRLYSTQSFTAQPAIVLGHLYALPLGYPTLTTGTVAVQGVLLVFANAAILETLDQFERHCPEAFQSTYPALAVADHEYQRSQIAVADGKGRSLSAAWAYTMTTEQVTRLGGVLLSGGEWSSQQQAALFAG